MAGSGEVGFRARGVESAAQVTPGKLELAAILLAGGASTRMGRPKALLDYQGEAFVDRLIRLFSLHCERVHVVLGHNAATIAAGMLHPNSASLILNPRPERGQLSSLQCGLRVLPRTVSAVFFHPVDIPGISGETIGQLANAWNQSPEGTRIVQPAFAGRKGHPVLLAPDVISELLALPPESSAREVIQAQPSRILTVQVSEEEILRDTDTPEDYLRLTGRDAQ